MMKFLERGFEEGMNLQKSASRLLLLLHGRGGNDGSDSFIENILQSLLGECRAFHEFDCIDFLGFGHSLFVRDGCHVLFSESVDGILFFSQIELSSDQDNGGAWAVMRDLRVPFGGNVLERRGRDDGETAEENISLRVREGSQSIVIFLSGSIPESKIDGLSIDHDIGRIVVKDSWDVFSGEGVGGVRDEEASFTDGSVTDYYTFN